MPTLILLDKRLFFISLFDNLDRPTLSWSLVKIDSWGDKLGIGPPVIKIEMDMQLKKPWKQCEVRC